MKKNSVLPLAAVLAIGAAWTMLSESGKKPLTVNMNPLGKSTTTTTVRAEVPALDVQIAALFSQPPEGIQVQDVRCQDASCTVELRGEPDVLQAHIEDLLRENPWLGPWDLQKKAGADGVFLAVFQPQPRS